MINAYRFSYKNKIIQDEKSNFINWFDLPI